MKQKALEDDVAGEMMEQDKLILNRSGRRVLLKDLMIRPNIAPGTRKLIGTLEAHTNGLRYGRPSVRADIAASSSSLSCLLPVCMPLYVLPVTPRLSVWAGVGVWSRVSRGRVSHWPSRVNFSIWMAVGAGREGGAGPVVSALS